MKRFLTKLILVLPVLIVIAVTNYIVDPANIFQYGKYEKGMATYVANNKYVTNVGNYDGRLVQKYTIEQLKYSPDITVFSSSRGQFVSADLFPGKKFYNAWVQSAALEDFIALYDLYEKHGINPKNIILTLDPRILNKNSPREKWRSISGNYYSMLRKLNIKYTDSVKSGEKGLSRYSQLLSLSLFQSSLKSVYKKEGKYFPSNTKFNDGYTRCPDGSLSYGKKMRETTVLESREKASAFVEAPATRSVNFDKIPFDKFAEKDVVALTAFVNYLQKKNVKITFFFSPFNPIVYKYFAAEPKYKRVIEAEQWFRDLATQKGISCIGSYDPAKYNLGEEYFYDGIHCNEKCVKVIFDKEFKL